MHHLLLFLFLFLLLPDATAAGSCNRQCGSTTVPYPFGFSSTTSTDCPILLTCNATTSTPLLPSTTTSSDPYPILSFNTSSSTFLVSLTPSCTRTVPNARAALNTASVPGAGAGGYSVSSRTGLFLRGGCASSSSPHNATSSSSSCNVPSGVMSSILRTAQCSETDASWTCVLSAPPAPGSSAAASGEDEFLRWDEVDAAGCQDALTSAVYADTAQGASIEFGVAEMGWWMEGRCSNGTGNGGGEGGGNLQCAANATCREVKTPSGEWGHRCVCGEGMEGDGFVSGDGCYYGGDGGGATSEHSKKKIFLIAAGVVAGVAAAAGLLLLLCRLHHRRRHKAGRSASSRLAAMRLLSEAATSSGVPVYSYAEIARATDSFSPTHRLGNGAYGTVYIGKLPGSSPTLVAIKRLRCRLHHDADDAAAEAAVLLNEIKLISSVSHPNLVRLLGFSLDGGEQILIYEFVPNGTLSHHLLSGAATGGGRRRLTWRERLVVAAETAAAIAYLHGIRPLPIFHRDVKSSNILLDASLRPKLADFGLSRAVDRLEAARSHVSTAPQGTPGYVDPEYHQNFHLSDKSDVYSFGVVLLELITAMKVVDFDRPADEVNLASLGLDRIGKGRVNEIVDPAILGDGEEEWVMGSVRLVSELAFRCLAFQKDVRPAMSEVAAELHRIRCAAPDGDGDGDDSEEHGARLRHGNMTDVQIDVSLDGSDAMAKKKKKKAAASPVSVQEVWVSDHSSPSTNGSMPRFAA